MEDQPRPALHHHSMGFWLLMTFVAIITILVFVFLVPKRETSTVSQTPIKESVSVEEEEGVSSQTLEELDSEIQEELASFEEEDEFFDDVSALEMSDLELDL